MTDAYRRKIIAVKNQITDPLWDAIYETAEMLGPPYTTGALTDDPEELCSPERSQLIGTISAWPQFSKAARDKVWRDA